MMRDTPLLNTIAKTMNVGGSVLVSAFDAGLSAFNCTMSALSPGERTKIATRIKTFEKKIQALTFEIAKETLKYPDPAAALEAKSVIDIINIVKELTKEIELMKQRIAELDKDKAVKKPQHESAGISNFIARSISGIMPGEKANLQNKVYANEKTIQNLYCEFAKEASKQADPSAAVISEANAGIISKINGLNTENEALKLIIADMDRKKSEKPAVSTEKKPQTAEKKPAGAKKLPPESCGVAKFFVNAITESVTGHLSVAKQSNNVATSAPVIKPIVEDKLTAQEKKIQNLYLEVAQETAKYADLAEAIAAEPIIALYAKINELKAEVTAMDQSKTEVSDVAIPVDSNESSVSETSGTANAEEQPVSQVVVAEGHVDADSTPIILETETNAEVAADFENAEPAPADVIVSEEAVGAEENQVVAESTSDEMIAANTTIDEEKSEIVVAAEVVDVVVAEAEVASEVAAIGEYAETTPVDETASEAVDVNVAADGDQAEAISADETETMPEAAAPEENQIVAETATDQIIATGAVAVNETPETVAAEFATEIVQVETTIVDESIPEEVASEENQAVAESTSDEVVTERVTDLVSEELEPPPALPVDDVEVVPGIEVPDTATDLNDSAEPMEEKNAAEVDAVNSDVSKESVTTHEEESVPVTDIAEEDQVVATTAHAELFSPASVYSSSIPAIRPKTYFSDKSEPVFRTRVYRNEFSILTAAPAAFSEDEKGVDVTDNTTNPDMSPDQKTLAIESEDTGADVAVIDEMEVTNADTSSEDVEEIDESDASFDDESSSSSDLTETDELGLLKKQNLRKSNIKKRK